MSALLVRPMANPESREPRPHASELRRGSRTPIELKREAEVLRELAGTLTEQAETMERAGVRRVPIDGDKKFTNGLKLLKSHLKAVRKGLVDLE